MRVRGTPTRLNTERYAVHGQWRERERRNYRFDDDRPGYASIVVASADLLEKRSGHVWSNGAFKVTLKNVPGMRSKTFYGESAWSAARCHASDAATKCGDHWWPDL